MKSLQLRYYNDSLVQKDQKVYNVISDCYNSLVLNAGTISRALGIASKGPIYPSYRIAVSVRARTDELSDLLSMLRDHEVSLTLSKYLNEYENTTLHQLVDACLDVIGKYESTVDLAFSRLCDCFKEQLLTKLSVSNEPQ